MGFRVGTRKRVFHLPWNRGYFGGIWEGIWRVLEGIGGVDAHLALHPGYHVYHTCPEWCRNGLIWDLFWRGYETL